MNQSLKAGAVRILAAAFLAVLLAAGLTGCGEGISSPKSDVKDLERVFELKPGTPPSPEPTAAAGAARAVAAIREQDWPRALSHLNWMRMYGNLTPDQARAVQTAYASAHRRLSELAANGNLNAKTALDRVKQEAERR